MSACLITEPGRLCPWFPRPSGWREEPREPRCKTYPEIHRVCGEVLCEDCGLPYRKHPLDPDHLSGIDGLPFLHRACDGRLLKL